MDFLENFTEWLSYNMEAIGTSIDNIAYNVALTANIIQYIPYAAVAFSVFSFVQFVIICSIKIQNSKIEKKIDDLRKEVEYMHDAVKLKGMEDNGEDAK